MLKLNMRMIHSCTVLALLGFFACEQDNSGGPANDEKDAATSAADEAPGTDNPTEGSTTGDANDAPEPGSLQLGEQCQTDAECESSICRTVPPLPGAGYSTPKKQLHELARQLDVKICASCRDHDQCVAENKGTSCMFSLTNAVVECVDGKVGSPCEEDKHCANDLMCVPINMGDNESLTKTCSECGEHTDCPTEGKRNCVSRTSNDQPGFFNLCLEDGVRLSGEICFPCATGNRECAEGFCVKVAHPNEDKADLCIGVCGSCQTDGDCAADERCEAPVINTKGQGLSPHTPSQCVKK